MVSRGTRQRVLDVMGDAAHGRLPDRYTGDRYWLEPYQSRAIAAVNPGQRIIDIGSGARPVLSREERPVDVVYVGLDISRKELDLAGAGAYDETIVASITEPLAGHYGRFDLALCYHVFEHVRPLAAAIENVRRLLRPGGHLVAEVPGRYSMVSVLNRVIPHRVAKVLLQRFLDREPDTVFPAYYDGCWHDALTEMFTAWSQFEIQPLFKTAHYLSWAPPLRMLYIGIEEWLDATNKRNLASNYLISATR